MMKKFPKCFVFLFVLALTGPMLKGATWYVSVKGNDQFPGSKEQPYRTINRAAAMAMPGDTVFVMEGVYRERVAPPRGGEPGLPIVYMGEPGKQVFAWPQAEAITRGETRYRAHEEGKA